MPVLEITLLYLRPGTQPTDANLVSNLRNIRAQLGTNSRFFIAPNSNPSSLYILGVWPTLEAHKAFLSSPDRARILGPQEDQTEFRWSMHVEARSMEDLPLKAPVMYFSRVFAQSERKDEVRDALKGRSDRAREATTPYPVLEGVSLEPDASKNEFVSFTGWSSEAAHKEFGEKLANLGKGSEELKEALVETEGAYLHDLEKLVFGISGSWLSHYQDALNRVEAS